METLEIVAFRAGAALTVLDQLVNDPRHGVPVKPLANRFALTAATATRDLQNMVQMGALIRTGVLRHTRYRLNLEEMNA